VFGAGPSRADREVYQLVLERFEDQLNINPINRSRLVAVQFDSQDPELAARVAIAWRKLTWNKTGRPVGGNAKGCRLAFTPIVGVKSKLENSEEQLQNYASV